MCNVLTRGHTWDLARQRSTKGRRILHTSLLVLLVLAATSGRLHHVVRTSVHLASCALPKPCVALCGPLRLIPGVNKTGNGPHDDSRMNAEEVSAGGLSTRLNTYYGLERQGRHWPTARAQHPHQPRAEAPSSIARNSHFLRSRALVAFQWLPTYQAVPRVTIHVLYVRNIHLAPRGKTPDGANGAAMYPRRWKRGSTLSNHTSFAAGKKSQCLPGEIHGDAVAKVSAMRGGLRGPRTAELACKTS
ncbi:hypothetical protein KC347_g253 [Hortaea werneckii]|nr:hypothetical protein KC347_g253 [Hortaea werneckii]